MWMMVIPNTVSHLVSNMACWEILPFSSMIFAFKCSFSWGFSIAMFDYRRVMRYNMLYIIILYIYIIYMYYIYYIYICIIYIYEYYEGYSNLLQSSTFWMFFCEVPPAVSTTTSETWTDAGPGRIPRMCCCMDVGASQSQCSQDGIDGPSISWITVVDGPFLEVFGDQVETFARI